MNILEHIYYEFTETQDYMNCDETQRVEELSRSVTAKIKERYGKEVADYTSDEVSIVEDAYEKAGFMAGFRIAVQLMQACGSATPAVNLFKEAKTA